MKFFVVGHGRSGTLWTARFLQKCNPKLKIVHEFMQATDAAMYGNIPLTPRWLLDRDTELRLAGVDGEINSYLRYSVSELRGMYHNIRIVGIIRNGHDVVQSMLVRGTTVPIRISNTWPRLPRSKIGSLALYWSQSYARMREAYPRMNVFRLEDLVRSDYVAQYLCDLLDVRFDLDVWTAVRDIRVNASRASALARKWDKGQVHQFNLYANGLQIRYGYV